MGMPPSVRDALLAGISDGVPEPLDTEFSGLRELFAQRHNVSVAQIAVAQTEEELIALLSRASGAKLALLPTPCPPAYRRVLNRAGIAAKELKLSPRLAFHFEPGRLKDALPGCDLLLMGNPAFPSGKLIKLQELLEEIAGWLEDGGRLILDERAIDFTYGSVANSLWSAVRYQPGAALIRSFTALLSLSVCPLCYAVGDKDWISAARSRQFHPALPPLASCLAGPISDLARFRADSVDCVIQIRQRLAARLRRVAGLRPLPADADWVLCRLERDDMTANDLALHLRRRAVIVEPLDDGRHFPLALRAEEENDRFVRAVREILMPKKGYQEMLPFL